MLRVSNAITGYGNIQVLRGVSFEVREGELVTILGTNGAGKTTTLQTISVLLPLWSGEIYFDDKPIHLSNAEKVVESGLVQVPEGRKLFADMTVKENLELGSFLPGKRKNKKRNMDYCYELFPILKERETQIAGTMSGGQQQMLAIGRALMSEPKLLILDEPSTGLSPLLTKQMFEIISAVKANGVTVLLVEQNVNQALALADRGYVMENGEIVMEGKAKDLLNDEKLKASYLGVTT